MAFTPAHAAAALPFRRTRLVPSALIVGCIAPDLEYFLFLRPHGHFGHSLPGLFLFDVPAGLLVLWLFHAYVKLPVSIVLPSGIQRRLKVDATAFPFGPPARLALLSLSILIGAVTHVVWDSFTHRDSWLVRHWSVLRSDVPVPIRGEIELDKLLQYVSSVIGIAALLIWVLLWYRDTKPVQKQVKDLFTAAQRRVTAVVALAATILGAIVGTFSRPTTLHSVGSAALFGAETFISATAFLWCGLLVCGVLFRRQTAAHQRA